MRVSPNQSTVDITEEILRKRTVAFDIPQTQSEPSVFQPRLQRIPSKEISGGTLERVLSNAFVLGSMGGPSARRPTRTQMTLPYFTFTPTIGRNSVCPFKFGG